MSIQFKSHFWQYYHQIFFFILPLSGFRRRLFADSGGDVDSTGFALVNSGNPQFDDESDNM